MEQSPFRRGAVEGMSNCDAWHRHVKRLAKAYFLPLRRDTANPIYGGTAVSDERLMTAIDALPEQIGNRETLERILDALSEREKGLVRERFVNGASFEEMAQKEKTTVGAIRSALARLRKKARRLAGDERG